MVDYEMAYKANEQLKFFMVADRFMHNKDSEIARGMIVYMQNLINT